MNKKSDNANLGENTALHQGDIMHFETTSVDFVSASCQGEKCSVCGKPATNKISEVIMPDDQFPNRHEFTNYVCQEHFDMVLRPYLIEKQPISEYGIQIKWDERYSSTMEDDKQGRWARIAYAGNFNNKVPFTIEGAHDRFEIAWVKKLYSTFGNETKLKFTVSPKFPYSGEFMFETLEEAKSEVENRFRFFIQNCVK